jgi:hypothetical protein
VQTIDDLDLLKYVAGGQDIDPSDGGDGGGDGDGDGGGGGGDGDGVTTADAVASVDVYAESLADSGVNTSQNAAIVSDAASGALASQVQTLETQTVSSFGVSASAGYYAGAGGQSLQQAEQANSGAFAGNPLGFAAGYAVGFIKHLSQ